MIRSDEKLFHTDDYLTHFDPVTYLNRYKEVYTFPTDAPVTGFIIENVARILKSEKCRLGGQRALEFGGGPNLWPSLLLAQYVDSISFCDYTQSNLDFVNDWIEEKATCYDWTNYFRAILEVNGTPTEELPSWENKLREALKKGGLSTCDVNNTACPILNGPEDTYDIIFTSLCLESACLTEIVFNQTICRLIRLLKPGGMILLGMVRNETFYHVGSKKFFCLDLNESKVAAALMNTQQMEDLKIFSKETSLEEQERNKVSDYDGIMTVRAFKQKM